MGRVSRLASDQERSVTKAMRTKIGTAVIVDDEVFDQKCARRILERSGVVGEVVCFGAPADALDFLTQPGRADIDVLLLDINMPRMSGFEFLDHALAALGPAFATRVVVMLTTSFAPQDIERAARYPVIRDYFRKPLRPAHVPRLTALVAGETPPDPARRIIYDS